MNQRTMWQVNNYGMDRNVLDLKHFLEGYVILANYTYMMVFSNWKTEDKYEIKMLTNRIQWLSKKMIYSNKKSNIWIAGETGNDSLGCT